MSRSLTDLFTEQLKLCKLKSSEIVAVISELGEKQPYVDAAAAAARSLGAGVIVLTATELSHAALPPVKPANRGVTALLAAAAESDLVIDVTVGGLIHSDVRTRITGRGKRMLFVAEPSEVLDRLIGSDEIRSRVQYAGSKLKSGKTLHVVSGAGTDLTADISAEDLPITHQWGFVDEPGRWDHWPSGFVACFPRDRSAQGRIVLQPGDVLLPWLRYVRDRITLEIKDGFIVHIAGEGADAFLLSDYFKRWNDPEVYALSHMGWGVHPRASWAALDIYEPRSLYGQELRSTEGNFMWSTGSNRFAKRETPAHLDIPMRGCTIDIDGEEVVRNGQLVG